MKKMVMFFLFLGMTLFAGDSLWVKHDFKAALTKAKETHKPILLMYSAKT